MDKLQGTNTQCLLQTKMYTYTLFSGTTNKINTQQPHAQKSLIHFRNKSWLYSKHHKAKPV